MNWLAKYVSDQTGSEGQKRLKHIRFSKCFKYHVKKNHDGGGKMFKRRQVKRSKNTQLMLWLHMHSFLMVSKPFSPLSHTSYAQVTLPPPSLSDHAVWIDHSKAIEETKDMGDYGHKECIVPLHQSSHQAFQGHNTPPDTHGVSLTLHRAAKAY